MQWAKKQTGFTIVELLIVVIVIAILATITIVGFNGIQNRAKQSSAAASAAQVSKKLAVLQVENSNQAPTQAQFDAIAASIPGTTFQYTPGSNGSYCVTATTSGVSYYISQGNKNPTAGSCFGDPVNGVASVVNLVPNPSFEENRSLWSVSGNSSLTHPSTGGYIGNRYLSLARTANAAIAYYSFAIPVSGPDAYTGSMWARYPAGRQATLRFIQYNANNDVIDGGVTGNTVTGNGNWQRLSFTNTMLADTRSVRFDIVMNTAASAIGDALDIDGAMLTQGSALHAYADGSSPGWQWQDTPHGSPSSGPAL